MRELDITPMELETTARSHCGNYIKVMKPKEKNKFYCELVQDKMDKKKQQNEM